METVFICPRCGNRDARFLGKIKREVYCRKCISFQGESVEEAEHNRSSDSTLSLDYQLTDDQRALSDAIVMCYREKRSVLVDAVTGAGKTEIVFALIQTVLEEGKKVAFIIPRKDVVIELTERFKKAFPLLTITALYGGHHDALEGDLVILTAHQVFRYQQYFDAVILDEVDAFPYRGNEVLEHFSSRAGKGFSVRMSATFTRAYLNEQRERGTKVLHLWTRFHRQPIPIPTWRRWLFFLKDIYLIDRLERWQRQRKPVLIFVPTIAVGRRLWFWLRWLVPKGALVHSKEKQRDALVNAFKKGHLHYLISTSILERGITIANVQAIVYESDHALFDAAALIQMAGRVGRKVGSTDGEVIFLAERQSAAMVETIARIRDANEHL